MKNKITISVWTIIVVLITAVIGYLIGRASVDIPGEKIITKIEYIKGEEIRDTIFIPKPYEVTSPSDTIKIPIPTDTAALYAIWKDYYTTRKYELDFSNDTLGIYKVNTTVSQNKLMMTNSYIKPNVKVITETQTILRVPVVQIFGMIGTSVDLQTNKIQLGIDLKQKYLIGLSGIRYKENYSYTIDLGIKF